MKNNQTYMLIIMFLCKLIVTNCSPILGMEEDEIIKQSRAAFHGIINGPSPVPLETNDSSLILKNYVENYQNLMKKLEDDYRNLETTYHILQEKDKNNQNVFVSLNMDIERLNNFIKELKLDKNIEIERLNSKQFSLEESFEKIKEDNRLSIKNNNELKSQQEVSIEEINTLKEEKTEATRKLEESKILSEQLSQSLKIAKEEIMVYCILQKQHDDLELKYKKSIKENQELKTTNKQLDAEIGGLRKDKDKLFKDKQVIKEKCTNLEKHNECIERLKTKEQELKILHDRLKDYKCYKVSLRAPLPNNRVPDIHFSKQLWLMTDDQKYAFLNYGGRHIPGSHCITCNEVKPESTI